MSSSNTTSPPDSNRSHSTCRRTVLWLNYYLCLVTVFVEARELKTCAFESGSTDVVIRSLLAEDYIVKEHEDLEAGEQMNAID